MKKKNTLPLLPPFMLYLEQTQEIYDTIYRFFQSGDRTVIQSFSNSQEQQIEKREAIERICFLLAHQTSGEILSAMGDVIRSQVFDDSAKRFLFLQGKDRLFVRKSTLNTEYDIRSFSGLRTALLEVFGEEALHSVFQIEFPLQGNNIVHRD